MRTRGQRSSVSRACQPWGKDKRIHGHARVCISREHRLPVSCRRQLGDDSEALQELLLRMIEELFGRLPKRRGWQPVRPGNRTGALGNFRLVRAAQSHDIPWMTKFDLRRQDCIRAMSRLADASVDLVVTSPPYNL